MVVELSFPWRCLSLPKVQMQRKTSSAKLGGSRPRCQTVWVEGSYRLPIRRFASRQSDICLLKDSGGTLTRSNHVQARPEIGPTSRQWVLAAPKVALPETIDRFSLPSGPSHLLPPPHDAQDWRTTLPCRLFCTISGRFPRG